MNEQTEKGTEIILVSDIHGKTDRLLQLKQKYDKADYFIHLGDCEAAPSQMWGFICVAGNNDDPGVYPDELILAIADHRLFLTHGHHYHVFRDRQELARRAIASGCDIACYGHTHHYAAEKIASVLLINPGSARFSRDSTGPSYVRMVLRGPDISWEHLAL